MSVCTTHTAPSMCFLRGLSVCALALGVACLMVI